MLGILSIALQLFGSVLLAAFSFRGIRIEESPNTFANGKPLTHVRADPKWLKWARVGLVALCAGLVLSSVPLIQALVCGD